MFFVICWIVTVVAAVAITVFDCLRYREVRDTETLIEIALNIVFYWAVVAVMTPNEVVYAITR